jgi:cation transport protein ChaC
MWRPGFAFEECCSALLYGYRRSLCVLSTRYRGTPEKPGLVLGLERGGCCRGVAYRVAEEKAEATRAYLFERELPTNVYFPRYPLIKLADGRRVAALAFVVDQAHTQYRHLTEEEKIFYLRQGVGKEGPAIDYLANTIRHMCELGFSGGGLARLLEKAQKNRPD